VFRFRGVEAWKFLPFKKVECRISFVFFLRFSNENEDFNFIGKYDVSENGTLGYVV